MEYTEPGIVYFLNRRYLFRIDLNTQEVLEKLLYENIKLLLRLLPVTSSEF